jgi:hypothetical protein
MAVSPDLDEATPHVQIPVRCDFLNSEHARAEEDGLSMGFQLLGRKGQGHAFEKRLQIEV